MSFSESSQTVSSAIMSRRLATPSFERLGIGFSTNGWFSCVDFVSDIGINNGRYRMAGQQMDGYLAGRTRTDRRITVKFSRYLGNIRLSMGDGFVLNIFRTSTVPLGRILGFVATAGSSRFGLS